MKISSTILLILLIVIVSSLFASNLVLKKQYQRVDKSDLYWNYSKILEQPFRHIVIEGGNTTQIAFEQNRHCSVRVLDYWMGDQKDNKVKAYVKNDTLHLKFLYQYTNLGDKYWIQSHVLVRVAAPELLSVKGINTNFEMDKMQQKSLAVNLSGKSRFEMESNSRKLDTLTITQADSTQVVFEMNPELKGSPTMKAKAVIARLQGVSILDIGHIYVNKPALTIADTAAVILSGSGLKSAKL